MLSSSITRGLIGLGVVGTGVTSIALTMPKSKETNDLEGISKEVNDLGNIVSSKCGKYENVYSDAEKLKKYEECEKLETEKWTEDNKEVLKKNREKFAQQKN